MKKKIGNIIADKDEFIPFKKALAELGSVSVKKEHNCEKIYASLKYNNNEIEIITIHSDIGKSAAAAAAAYLIAENCDYIINSGLSGAISGVGIDDIVVSDDFLMSDFDVEAISSEKGAVSICELPLSADGCLKDAFIKSCKGAKIGRLSTADSFICDTQIKNRLKSMGVTACDMESAAIAYVCNRAEIPFLSFRRISDNADDIAYNTYKNMNGEQSVKLFEITVDFLESILRDESFFK